MNYITSKASFGVEIEFLIAMAKHDQELTVPEMFKNATGKPIVGDGRRINILARRLNETIAKTLTNHRGRRVVKSSQDVENNEEAYHLKSFQNWTIGSDLSVEFPEHLREHKHLLDYEWHPAEISSPALWATEESWEEIRAVIKAIGEQYWIIVPPTAGMHFHYGHGTEYIPVPKLRRMAALFLAIDPIFVQLLPPHRRDSKFCLSNRHYARIARGDSAEFDVSAAEAPMEAEPEVMPQKPVQRQAKKSRPAPRVPFQRGELTGYDLSKSIFNQEWTETYQTSERPTIAWMANTMLNTRSAPMVAELMSHPIRHGRLAYNFRNYAAAYYKRVIQVDGIPSANRQYKRTVEFRQMASTMVADEVVAFGKVIVGLCEFAGQASLDQLWNVVFDCDTAETDSTWYDAFDMISDLGLDSEANVFVESITRFKNESTIPVAP